MKVTVQKYPSIKSYNATAKLCMKHAGTVCKHVCFHFCPLASFNSSHVFYPPPLLLLSCFYLFIFYPCQPSFPFPDATKVKQEQCSVSPHLSCRNKTHTQLCNAKNAWMKQGRRDTEAWGGWMWNEEHASATCILPSQHAQTNKPSCYSTATRGSSQHTNVHRQLVKVHGANAPKPGQWVEQKRKTIERERKEYLALPSGVRDLGKRKQTRRKKEQREKVKTEAHQYYSCIVIMHALHDGKPWQSLWKQSFPKSIWKLSLARDR